MSAANILQGAELRLARYYAQKLRQMNEYMKQGGALLTTALNTFDQELAQIRYWQGYVVNQAGYSVEHDRLLVEFALNILVSQQPFDEQIAWLQPGLAATQRLNDHQSESALLKDMSYALLRQGDLPAARETAEQALKLAQQSNNKFLESGVILRLGQIMSDSGEFELAKQYLQHAIDLGDLDTKSKIKINTWLGYIAYCEDDFEASGSFIDENIRLSRALGDLSELATALVNRGMTYIDIGKDHEGIPLIRESISIQRKLGEKNLIGHGLQTLVNYYIRLGSLAEAQHYADEHMTIALEIGSPVELIWARGSLAAISRERGDYQRAYDYLLEDQQVVANSTSLGSMIYHQYTLASVLLPLGKYEEAKALCLRLLADESPLLEQRELSDLHNFLGWIAMAEENLDQAIAMWNEALTLAGNQSAQQITLRNQLANAYLLKGDSVQAQKEIITAQQIEHEQGGIRNLSVIVETRTIQSKLHIHLGELHMAKDALCDSLSLAREIEVIIPKLNILVAASEYLAAIGNLRSIQTLSLVAHHAGTPLFQRISCVNQQAKLAEQFGIEVSNHHWKIGEAMDVDSVLADLLVEWSAAPILE